MLGLVSVLLGLGFLGLRVLSRLGFSRFSCGMVCFRDFQRLQVFFGQGISQGQFWFRGVEVCLGFRVLLCLGCARFSYGWLGFVVFRRLEVFSCQGISQGQLRFCRVGFSRVFSSFLPRVGQVYLRLGRVQCFLPFRGLFLLGYILGLVTVVQGCFFLGFRVLLRLGLARFAYGWVGFRVFQRLEVFSGQGIHQGQLRLCRVEVFRVQSSFAPRVNQVCLRLGRVQGFSAFRCLFRLGYILGLVTVFQGLGFFKFRVFSRLGFGRFAYGFVGLMVFQCLEVFSGQGISQGQLRLCRVQVFQGLEWLRAQGWLGFLSVWQGLGFFSSQRYFAVRVYLRVSNGCVGFRLFKGLD